MSAPVSPRRLAQVLLVLVVPLFLGAWKLSNEPGINPRHVQRIQDGKTKKAEILTWFGDPQEKERLPEGEIYVYKTFRPKNELPRRKAREPKDISVDPYALDRQAIKISKEENAKELASTLVIRFQPDGETVQSHDYKEF